jgi:hypothetical protein
MDLFVTYHYFMWTLFYIMWNLYNSMNCTCIICIVLLWLIPHPIDIWLTYGSVECNKDVCMYVFTCPEVRVWTWWWICTIKTCSSEQWHQ